ncbi:MAG: LuxR C-terminal-related transcriptional regulator [Candidatus Velthaea sp.]
MAFQHPALSPRQAEIANLVAGGRSNREIAVALHLSERTVESHIATLFNKLTVRSRTELVAAVLRSAAALSPDCIKTNLPLQLNRLVGREAEVAHLTALLAAERLVTITGAGGVGKTRVALQVGAALVNAYPSGAWLVELAALGEPALIGTEIARAVGVDISGTTDPLEMLGARFARQTLLLVLDNCEHLITGAARVAETLARHCPNLRILATSREPLKIAGEHSYRLPSLRVPPLETARGQPAAAIGAYEAVELFVDRARAVEDHFTVTDENAPAVARICRRLDGIPLAIELAAARINVLPVNALAERLDQRLRILTGGLRTSVPRHQTMRVLIDWSYNLLAPAEQRLFERLAVFAGGCTLAAAVAVCSGAEVDDDAMFTLLGSLVDKSLVSADLEAAEPRYRLAESAREYAREKLAERGELGAAVARQRLYLRDLFAAARTRAERTGWSSEIGSLLRNELDDVRAALDEAAGRDLPELGAELLDAIDDGWISIGLEGEGCARLERLAVLLPDGERRLTSALWAAFARLAAFLKPVRALEAAATAVEAARDADDRDLLARALTTYAVSLSRVRQFQDAAAALAEADALAPSLNVALRLRITGSKALLSYFLGDLEGAAQGYEFLRDTHFRLGNVAEAASIALDLAENKHQRGQTEIAIALVQEVLPVLRAGSDRRTLLLALANLCGYFVALDRLAEARAVGREVFQDGSEHDRDRTTFVNTIEHSALVLALDGDVRRGAQLAGYTDAAYARAGFHREYTESTTRARLAALFRERLTPAECEALLAAGAALSIEAAIALALADRAP